MSNKKVQLKDKAGNNIYPQLVKQCILDVVYPIGSIYISVNTTSPATLFGGTWTQITDRFLYCTTTSKTTGGEANHTLTESEMPSHSHIMPSVRSWIGDGNISWIVDSGGTAAVENRATTNTGGGQPHNNMPPYFTVYAWYRTA